METLGLKNEKFQTITYVSFICVGLFFAIAMQDYAQGATFIALSLVFSPYLKQPINEQKSITQRLLIAMHFVAAIALIALALFSIATATL